MREKIIYYLKLFLLVWPAFNGYLFANLFIWYILGLPMTWWATVILSVLAGLSEYGTIRWVGGD